MGERETLEREIRSLEAEIRREDGVRKYCLDELERAKSALGESQRRIDQIGDSLRSKRQEYARLVAI